MKLYLHPTAANANRFTPGCIVTTESGCMRRLVKCPNLLETLIRESLTGGRYDRFKDFGVE